MDDDPKTIIEEKFVRTEVVQERGQWVVYVEIGDTEETVRHRISAYHRKSLADLAAHWINRTAEKDKPFNA